MSLLRTLSSPRVGWFAVALLSLACAVATEPELKDDEGQPSAGSASLAGSPSVGSTSSVGGSKSQAGAGSGGTVGTAGKATTGGTSSAAGTSSGGKGGTATAGSGSGGKGGSGTAGSGTAGSGTAGSGTTGCTGLKTWKSGDSTLQIAAGEVIQWMGKRYKATAAVAYPNAECVPDKPVDWCASWFEPDGDC